MTAPTWEYVNPSELATNGIHTEQELDQIREQIMFPVEHLWCEILVHAYIKHFVI